jgi:hypothetical protein
MHAAIAVGNLGHHYPDRADDYAERLAAIADDEDPDVRVAVAIALSQLPTEAATPTLQALAEDHNPDVAETAAEALQGRGGGGADPGPQRPDQNPYSSSGTDTDNPYASSGTQGASDDPYS